MQKRFLFLPGILATTLLMGTDPVRAAPELLSGPYVIDVRTDRATVCWQTVKKTFGKVVYHGKGEKASREAAGKKGERFHSVEIPDLRPGVFYQAKVFAGKAELGALTFRTVPAKADRFTFFVYGDTRSNPHDHERVAEALAVEARRLRQFTFVVLTGDLARRGSNEEETAEQFFGPAAPVLRMMPIVPMRGNHECGTDLFQKYFPAPQRLKATGYSDDYCFDYGSVRMIILDQYAGGKTYEPRMKWLAARLTEARDQWRIVGFHEPMYSSGSHGGSEWFRKRVEPTLVKGKVHAVFCGHDHNYERSGPQRGITHFTSGGGGAPLRRQHATATQSSRFFKSVHHFMTIEVTPKKLLIKACQVDHDATAGDKPIVMDSVEILRDCEWK